MPSNSANEWSLLKEKFDAMLRNDCAREDNLEDLLDHEVRRRPKEPFAINLWTHKRKSLDVKTKISSVDL